MRTSVLLRQLYEEGLDEKKHKLEDEIKEAVHR